MPDTFDVAILGAGTAGLAALREVRKATENFVLIQDGPYGTTCARVGCMPSKALIEAARAYHQRTKFEAFGIRGASALKVDIPSVLRRVRALRDSFVQGAVKATDDLGDRNLAGRARLLDAQTVEVSGRRIRARSIIIATGSHPVVPAQWAAFGSRILTSDGLFELEDLPRRIAVAGAGPIGAEMAQALSRLGIRVALFDKSGSIAGLTDPAINRIAITALEQEMQVCTGASVEIESRDGALVASGGGMSFAADAVLAALGRRPAVSGLGLERLGLPLDHRGLPPFHPETMQIENLPVFLAGDVNGRAPLLHEAADDGHIAGRNALRSESSCHQRRTPLAIVFTDPNIAMVGRRYRELEPQSFIAGRVEFARHGRARTAETNQGALAIYADRQSGRIFGAEICAPGGEHLAHLLALAIQQSLTVAEFLRMPFYHPVLEEGLRTALRRAGKDLADPPESDLAACDAFGIEALD